MTNTGGTIMRILRRGFAAAAWSVTFAGSSHAQATRDSAGIRIVENARPQWSDSDALHLSAAPVVVIGKQEGTEYKFGRIRHVARLSDARIMVADGASLQLRFFDASGRFLKSAAGKGTAPGELSGMSQVFLLRADTIAVASGFAPASLYTGAGEFVRTIHVPVADDSRPPRELLLTMLANGTRVIVPLPNQKPREPGARWIDSLPLRLVDRDHKTVKDLGGLPHLVLEMNGKEMTQPWLSAIAAFASSADRFYTGFGDEYAIRVYSATGDLQSIIRRAWTPVVVTPERWDYWVVEWAKLWVKSVGEQYQKEMMELRASPYAETLPAFSQFIVDRAGRLWVREAHLEDAIAAGSLNDPPAVPSKWSVFDTSGRWLGDVSMPANFQPYDIGSDYVAGKRYADKVATAEIYALEKSSARSR
jgi:hypothetical protein